MPVQFPVLPAKALLAFEEAYIHYFDPFGTNIFGRYQVPIPHAGIAWLLLAKTPLRTRSLSFCEYEIRIINT